eukprot:6210507-Pleurochrysis_carterae.AAC.1
MVESAADGTSDKRTEKARTLLPAGTVQLKWPADEERDEPESFTSCTWTILHRTLKVEQRCSKCVAPMSALGP